MTDRHLFSRLQGCWMGKSIGGTLGLPFEGKMERLHLSFYDPVPTMAPPNDDLELQLVWLHIAEQSVKSLDETDFSAAWLTHIHYMWDEYGRCRWNLRRGVPQPNLGTFENPFHSGMGAVIRSEIWACLFPGCPDGAASYAAKDALIDHGIEGASGEIFFSALQSMVVGGMDIRTSIAAALPYIPDHLETARAIRLVLKCHDSGKSDWSCWSEIIREHGNENFTHAPLNVALTVWALCYGAGDFDQTILLAVNGGYDTDCTAATAGATLGLHLGIEGIPAEWKKPIGEEVYVGYGIRDIQAPRTLTELSERTFSLIGKFAPERWDNSIWNLPQPNLAIADLPGTIFMFPAGSNHAVAWANGEIPVEVKKAGGASWLWEVATDSTKEIVFDARSGGKLFVDDILIVECAAGQAFVPATHRSSNGARSMTIKQGSHTVRLELGTKDSSQEASVLLAYPNLHLSPWTKDELPYPAIL